MAYEYVTSTVSLHENDGIVVHVLNYSSSSKRVRARIFHNTGAGARELTDSGNVEVTPMWNWGLGYTTQTSGEFWVLIDANSELLIPKVSFERHGPAEGWEPTVTYNPGDFAVFDRAFRFPRRVVRTRLW